MAKTISTSEITGESIIDDVPVLDETTPLTDDTKMYLDIEKTFRQIPLSRLFNWLKGKMTQVIYPVGAIYMTMNNINPAEVFGGTWEKVSGKFLLGSKDGEYAVGSNGGSATQSLTISNMPNHSHSLTTDGEHSHNGTIINNGSHNHTPSVADFNFSVSKDFRNANDDVERVQVALQASGRRAITAQDSNSIGQTRTTSTNGEHTHDITISSSGLHTHSVGTTGDGQPYNNMPPYLVVNIWRRIS